MITEQQVIEKMRQTMAKIEQTSGNVQVEHIAAMKAYCGLLLEQSKEDMTSSSVVLPSVPQTTQPKTPDVDPMLARFMGVGQEKDEKGPSLLDF
ncbi:MULTISPECIES: DUF5327 family protein [Exiguobacterium]|uniref:DUF5327 family protein n=1 Tax=Exiguobacterium TaxID=33986 RepID=UPI00047A5C45|nr:MULTISPECIES: DUF5327 family protein [Exiguobacterium]MCT4779174.1 YwdI family protein [Exiguobacterium soli]